MGFVRPLFSSVGLYYTYGVAHLYIVSLASALLYLRVFLSPGVYRRPLCLPLVLDVEVYPKMLRNKSKAVPEGIGHIPQDACVMLGGITLEELR